MVGVSLADIRWESRLSLAYVLPAGFGGTRCAVHATCRGIREPLSRPSGGVPRTCDGSHRASVRAPAPPCAPSVKKNETRTSLFAGADVFRAGVGSSTSIATSSGAFCYLLALDQRGTYSLTFEGAGGVADLSSPTALPLP